MLFRSYFYNVLFSTLVFGHYQNTVKFGTQIRYGQAEKGVVGSNLWFELKGRVELSLIPSQELVSLP